MKQKILPLASLLVASTAFTTTTSALTIATESFFTDGMATTYDDGTQLGNTGQNDRVPTGTVGFNATNPWNNLTGNVRSFNRGTLLGLTHSGLVGTAQPGTGGIQSNSSFDRNSNRVLASTPPTSSSYFLSGLVRLDPGSAAPDEYRLSMGFMDSIAANTVDYSSGFHLGLWNDGTDVNVAVFANDTNFALVPVTDTSTVYQVVVRLDVNASGNEELSAWYAVDGDTSLTQAISSTVVGDIWDTPGDLDTFVLQSDSNGSTTTWSPFDEMRFGTTLADVSSIPEPSAFGALVGVAVFAWALRRRRLTS